MGYALGHTGNLIFGRASVGGMTLVGETERGDALSTNVRGGEGFFVAGG